MNRLARAAGHLVCQQRGPDYYDPARFRPQFCPADDFEVLEPLGEGKSAFVFRGVDLARKPCIIKLRKPEAPVRVFQREALVLTRAQHVAQITRLQHVASFGEHPDVLVLQHDSGKDLLTSKGFVQLSAEEMRAMLGQVLAGLQGLHAAGIMHRDVKPNNIVKDGLSFKLIDLGMAEFYLPDKEYKPRVGTRKYMSPEQLLGHTHYDFAVDIWGLAMTTVSLLLNRALPTNRDYEPLLA
jgi:casein kinase II subunit alpha